MRNGGVERAPARSHPFARVVVRSVLLEKEFQRRRVEQPFQSATHHHAQGDRLAVLDNALARGLADAEAGLVRPAADVFSRLEAKYQTVGRPAE